MKMMKHRCSLASLWLRPLTDPITNLFPVTSLSLRDKTELPRLLQLLCLLQLRVHTQRRHLLIVSEMSLLSRERNLTLKRKTDIRHMWLMKRVKQQQEKEEEVEEEKVEVEGEEEEEDEKEEGEKGEEEEGAEEKEEGEREEESRGNKGFVSRRRDIREIELTTTVELLLIGRETEE